MMRVELRHHDGWRVYDVQANTLRDAAYRALRQTLSFLDDKNHAHTFRDGPRRVVIWRNGKSPNLPGLTPAWVKGGNMPWFSVRYRVPVE